ncbi:hypothetical protein [Pseudomonas japonica]|uniref:hypothetical protein n=1 Tax=Pseudomonas japonica TaxID=256466 RepID=UPI0015E2DAA1|nr:hypothetical protein [Pseudomonas japonica]MBA1243827.1 hypothetical protein [Pseudomonas japonica]
MNSTTFHFNAPLALAAAAAACCLALVYGAIHVRQPLRLRLGYGVAWICLAVLAGCLVAWFKSHFPSLETAPRPVQWQLGATLAAGALLARVSLLRAGELAAADGHGAVRLARIVRWQLVAAAVLLGVGTAVGMAG